MSHFDEGVAGATPPVGSMGHAFANGGYPAPGTSPVNRALDMMVPKREGSTEDVRDMSEDESQGDAPPPFKLPPQSAPHRMGAARPPRPAAPRRPGDVLQPRLQERASYPQGVGAAAAADEGRAAPMAEDDELADLADTLLLLHESG